MRVVVQRVTEASVMVEDRCTGKIRHGLLVLAGFEEADTEADLKWMAAKIVQMRIFDDDKGVMNKSIDDVQGNILLVSQFTLHASTKKGNRPAYIRAAKPATAIPLYGQFIVALQEALLRHIQTGVFGADMKVHLVNDGPVTIIIDSRNKE